MRFLILAVMLVAQVAFPVYITTAQKYRINNQFSAAVPFEVQLGTILENLDPTGAPAALRGGLQTVDLTLTTAQVLALFTTPITVVAAPGAGYTLVPEGLYSTLTYNSVAYSCNAAGISIKYTDGSGVAPGLALTQAHCQSSATSQLMVQPAATAYVPTANAALVIHAGTANPTTGNSAIKLRLYYRKLAVPLP